MIALPSVREFIPNIKSGVFGILGIMHTVVRMGFEYGDKNISMSRFPSADIVSPEALTNSCGWSSFHLCFGSIFLSKESCIHDISAPESTRPITLNLLMKKGAYCFRLLINVA